MTERIEKVNINGLSLNISVKYRHTSDQLVVFFHGLGCSRKSFIDVWDFPAFHDKSLLCIDLPGFGKTDYIEGFSCHMEDYALVCEAVINNFTYSTLHVVGHSMGGAIVLLLSQRLLEALASFTNIEGNLVSEDCGTVSRETAASSYERFLYELLPNVASRFGNEGDYLDIQEMSSAAFYRSACSLVKWSESGELLKRFRNLQCRKIFFYGDKNAWLSVLKQLNDIDKNAIKGSGHFPMNDNPAEFYGKLSRFIDGKDLVYCI